MLKVQLLAEGAKAPTVGHAGEDLGYDVYALEDTTLYFETPTKVRTGIAVAAYESNLIMPAGYNPETRHYAPGRPLGLLVRDRSSMAAKGVFTHGGVIDAGYRGEIIILMTSFEHYKIKAGDKIAQLIPVPVLTGEVHLLDTLPEAARGANGFGSTGR